MKKKFLRVVGIVALIMVLINGGQLLLSNDGFESLHYYMEMGK